MAAFNKFYSFVEALAEKAHNLGSDQLAVALTDTPPAAENAYLSEITQVDYANLSSRNISTFTSGQTVGVYKLVLDDLILTATGGAVGPFRWVVIYNDSAASKELIGYFDYGQSITLLDGETLTIDFDDTNGLLQLE